MTSRRKPCKPRWSQAVLRAVAGGLGCLTLGAASGAAAPAAGADALAEERRQMVREQIRARGIEDRRVLAQMRSVPRHRFVPAEQREFAYRDGPLPIGHGQTISQPYVVALMTEALEPGATDRVLEVGTGSGYQAAVLSGLVAEVHTVEIIEALATSARERLKELGYDKVTVYHRDGYHGLPPKAPFDAIIVTAAAGQIPPPLLEQLRPGGRMVIPVGPPYGYQKLLLVTKSDTGEVRTRTLAPVRFVPLTGDH